MKKRGVTSSTLPPSVRVVHTVFVAEEDDPTPTLANCGFDLSTLGALTAISLEGMSPSDRLCVVCASTSVPQP